MEKIKRSPMFYVGDKYKLIKEIKQYFPKDINTFIEPFVGGGTVFLNVEAKKYILNDIDKNIWEQVTALKKNHYKTIKTKKGYYLIKWIKKRDKYRDIDFPLVKM